MLTSFVEDLKAIKQGTKKYGDQVEIWGIVTWIVYKVGRQ